MCDPHVAELLKQWGVSSLQDRCREQEVDLDALRTFSEDVITELVPLLGPRSKFIRGWRAWKTGGASAPAVAADPASATASAFSAPSAPPVGLAGRAVAGGRAVSSMAARCKVTTERDQPNQQATRPRRIPRDQLEPSQLGDTREVSVLLEGKITYDDENSALGWLVADGFLNPRRGSAGASGDNTSSGWRGWPSPDSVKTEPMEYEYDNAAPLPDLHEVHEAPGAPRFAGAPRFQLQGRITLSLQDFADVPAFMLGSSTAPEVVDIKKSELQPDAADPESATQQPSSSSASSSRLNTSSPAGSATAVPEVFPTPRESRPASPASRRPPAKRARRERPGKTVEDLEALLNSSSKGKMILSLYQQKGSLDGPARQSLTDIIIAEELREDFNKRITSQDFQDIAACIVDLFPGENEDTYFYNERAYGERPGGKGKLTSKYYNTRRQLARSGVISRGNREKRQMSQKPLTSLQLSDKEEEIAEKSCKWLNQLQNSGWHKELSPKDLEMTLLKWSYCWKIRMLRILSPGHHPSLYVDEYPVLRMALGEKLIKADFDMMFRDAENCLLNDWPNFSKSVINMLLGDHRKQLPLLDYVKRHVKTVKGREAAALLLLPSTLPVSTCKGQGETAELWRPTRQEAQDGFLLHVENEEDVNAALQQHWSRLRVLGQPMCPLPVVVGPSLDELESAIVALDENTAFNVPDVLSAVDLCFKSFHALQVQYPPHAQNVWLFLQHAVYRLATPLDRVSVAVSSLLADFGLKPVPAVESWDQVLQRP